MPTKPKASAPASEPAADATKSKPKATRRRASPKRKTAPAKAAASKSKAPASRATKPKADAVATRSKAAVAKLQSAIEKLEAALGDSPRAEAAIPTPPMKTAGSASKLDSAPPPPPAPTQVRPEIEVESGAWRRAAGPAMATAAFLVFVATLMVGYGAGYAVGTDAVDDSMVLVASAAERPTADEPAPLKAATPAQAPVVADQEPAPIVQPVQKAAPVAVAAAENGGGLHLQVSALKSREAATQLGARLESEGFPVKVREPAADGFVRVLVGPVSDSEQLTAMANRLREEGLKPFPKRL